ncbi:hypothetical protein BDN72DRAFT_824504 [Pluteus cervinus]|uniref:Uncharacterized protein n=1 Tax=Pluteus cervinus TaxID=181527 RepID=A0ACD3AIQ3_9AGAR|nr:hypothetical protein BDN72DRAFT_824504 [Pluteus cervinus]
MNFGYPSPACSGSSTNSGYPSPACSEEGEVIAGECTVTIDYFFTHQSLIRPSSQQPSNEEGFEESISISTAFNPESHSTTPDLIFSSSDCVLFYVDMEVVAKACPPAFQSAISASPVYDLTPGSTRIILIHETSPVLNVILHALYGTSCAQHSPPFKTLVDAVDHMPLYDISPAAHITSSSHTYAALIAYAPVYPLQVYALAGHHHLYDLAAPTSSHLLSYSLPSMSDETAQRMGWLYLKRLFDLHMDRFNALKGMLLCPPYPHAATRDCSFTDQARLTRAWALVAAYLAWDARADLSTHSIKQAFNPLMDDLTCQVCRESLEGKIHEIVVKWSSVRVSKTFHIFLTFVLRDRIRVYCSAPSERTTVERASLPPAFRRKIRQESPVTVTASMSLTYRA